MRIATWNINSVRRRLPLVLDWLGANQPDVLCLQETKVQDSDFPASAFREAGYQAAFRGMKGYNGVATLSHREPEAVLHGLCEGPDSEDVRIVKTVIRGIPIVNTYIPQGFKVGTDKYVAKLDWFHRIRRYFGEHLDPNLPAIWLGDLNVAPEPVDVYHPDRRVNDPDFHIDAREAYRHAIGWGFTDVFRKLYPDRVQYTYWDYFRNAFGHNWGWRIDHILATAPLAAVCRASDVDLETRRAREHPITPSSGLSSITKLRKMNVPVISCGENWLLQRAQNYLFHRSPSSTKTGLAQVCRFGILRCALDDSRPEPQPRGREVAKAGVRRNVSCRSSSETCAAIPK